MSKHVVNTCGYAHIRPRSRRTKEKTLSSSRQWKSSRAPLGAHISSTINTPLETPIQTLCRFPRISPSRLSEYPLKSSHPNTRGNFVWSLYESLRKIPRTPPYISPWKPFPRCGEFFSNPSSNHLNINWKIYSLLSSLPSRLGLAQRFLPRLPTPAQPAAGAQPSPPLSLTSHGPACPRSSLRPARQRLGPTGMAARGLLA